MHCREAIHASASKSAGADTNYGRVIVTANGDQVFLHLVPRLADSGLLNEAGSTVHEMRDVDAAAHAAASDYGADETGWIPVEELPSPDATTHTPNVEGHRLKADHEAEKKSDT